MSRYSGGRPKPFCLRLAFNASPLGIRSRGWRVLYGEMRYCRVSKFEVSDGHEGEEERGFGWRHFLW